MIQSAKLMNSTGKLVDVFNIKEEDVSTEVILLGACRINRYLGQTIHAYPVASHLLGGYQYLKDTNATNMEIRQWLLHEAFESYTGVDLPSPLKAMIPVYKEAEIKALEVMGKVYKVNPYETQKIKDLDRSIMIEEALLLMGNKRYWENFAVENNIKRLENGSKYVLPQELCNEKYLYDTLKQVWEETFEINLNQEQNISLKDENSPIAKFIFNDEVILEITDDDMKQANSSLPTVLNLDDDFNLAVQTMEEYYLEKEAMENRVTEKNIDNEFNNISNEMLNKIFNCDKEIAYIQGGQYFETDEDLDFESMKDLEFICYTSDFEQVYQIKDELIRRGAFKDNIEASNNQEISMQ